ncbi:glycoside hydrolase family 6 protein [Curtobacterium sp. MCBD17_028]|uniref:glycoside hydrolase family 6 protein n=1 Tax=Curtobacterium sp. MCBD17_028 TaxID=2175670 RepID=UPI000DA702FA|nr:glycoside hydrolase family 6 protein [Curtobacterium sp. MCBD17_028]PZE28703.1 hypothetical protein DEI86_02690 [Curtobacterium sp. MCBD17_028]
MNRIVRAALVAAAVASISTTTAITETVSASAATATVTPATIRTAPTQTIYQGGLYVQPDSQPAQAAATLAAQGRATEAAAARTIARQPIAIWLGEWFQGGLLDSTIARNLASAESKGTTPVFVTYAIPDRDCGGYSAGGLTPAQYTAWNQQIADDLHGHRAVVLVEPDSLAMLPSCSQDASTRLPLLRTAVAQFHAAGVPAYLDGGNSSWNAPAVTASELNQAGVSQARGFFTNVSNFNAVDPERSYAGKVSALTGGSHFVIDVSRNGRGARGDWCNPAGAGLGQDPHVTYGSGQLDALLWVKTPGASDGTCNGGPAAGDWFASYAVGLVQNAAR